MYLTFFFLNSDYFVLIKQIFEQVFHNLINEKDITSNLL
jgi:hypothetical protein